MPETVDPSCFLGLPPEQRWEQLYWAAGGQLTCFLGLSRYEQQKAFLEDVGAVPCVTTEEAFLRSWGAVLGISCMEGPLEELRSQIYAALYAEAFDPITVPPECFMGLSPEGQELALFTLLSSGEVPVVPAPTNFLATPSDYSPVFEFTWDSSPGSEYDEILIGDETWFDGTPLWIRAQSGVVRSVEDGNTIIQVRSIVDGVPTESSSVEVSFLPTYVLASSVATPDGVTDSTAALQAVLDMDTDADPVMLVLDATEDGDTYAITGLSGRRIKGSGAGLFLANGSNRPVIQNPNRFATDGSHEPGVLLKDFWFDGNCDNQTKQETGMPTADCWVMGLFVSHVQSPRIQNVQCIQSKTFAMMLCDYVDGLTERDIENVQPNRRDNQDGPHHLGPGAGFAYSVNYSGNGNDDSVIFSADEVDNFTVEVREACGVTIGAFLDRIEIDGVTGLEGSSQGVRLLSKNFRIEDVRVRHVQGVFPTYCVNVGAWGLAFGNYGRVVIEDVIVRLGDTAPDWHGQPPYNIAGETPLWCSIAVNAIADSIIIRRLSVPEDADGRGFILVGERADVAELNIESPVLSRTGKTRGWLVRNYSGNVDSLTISDGGLCNVETLLESESGGTIGDLMVTNTASVEAGPGAAIKASGDNLTVMGYSGRATITDGIWATTNFSGNIILPNLGILEGLIAAWNLASVADQTGVYGLQNNSVTFAPGKIGNGAVFNGTNAYFGSSLDVSNFPSVLLAPSFTICGWAKSSVAGAYVLISQWGQIVGGSSAAWQMYLTPDGILHAEVYIDTESVAGAATGAGSFVFDGSWNFFAMRVDGVAQNVEVRINAGGWISTAYAAPVRRSSKKVLLGANSDTPGGAISSFLDGMMDATAIWYRALSDLEVTDLYNSGAGKEYPFT